MGGDFLFRARAQCIDVNARNYRQSESHSKVCQMCDMGEDETVEHVILECQKYDRDIIEMMRVILTEMGCEINEVTGTGTEIDYVVNGTVWRDECKDDFLRKCGMLVLGSKACI